jgi:hypothetical protein
VPTKQFRVFNSAQLTNVTGDGTNYTVAFNSESYDDGNMYDTSAYTATAPAAGYLRGCVQLDIEGPDQTVDSVTRVQLVTSGGITYYLWTNGKGLYTHAGAGGGCGISAPFDIKLASGETVVVKLYVAGVTKIVDVYGTSDGNWSSWSAQFIPS